MKEIKTCEDYVLAELEEKKAQVQKLTEVCKEYLEVRKTKKSRLALFLLDFAFQVIDHVGICFDAFHP